MNPTYTDSYSSDTDAADFSTGTESSTSTSTTNTSSTGVSQAVSDAVSQVKDQVNDVKGQVAPAVQQTKEKAVEVATQVTEKAASRLDEQKATAAEGLTSIADALRNSGQQVRNDGQGPIPQFAAQYGDVAADQIERVSTYLRDKDTREILHDVEGFARREPAIFIGGALLLGVLAGRFLRSSAPSGSSAQFSSSTSTESTALALPAEEPTFDTPVATSFADTDTFTGTSSYDASSTATPDLDLLDDTAFSSSSLSDDVDSTDVLLTDDSDTDTATASDNTFSEPIKG